MHNEILFFFSLFYFFIDRNQHQRTTKDVLFFGSRRMLIRSEVCKYANHLPSLLSLRWSFSIKFICSAIWNSLQGKSHNFSLFFNCGVLFCVQPRWARKIKIKRLAVDDDDDNGNVLILFRLLSQSKLKCVPVVGNWEWSDYMNF